MIRIIAKRKRKQLDNITVIYIITKDNGYYLAMDIHMKKNNYLNRILAIKKDKILQRGDAAIGKRTNPTLQGVK